MPQVLQLEALLSPELAAQRALPYFSRISAGLRWRDSRGSSAGWGFCRGFW